ncbi:hypothetical protein JHN59_14725 [Streptomyces sp. MBT49]|uniref:hypothetical protein n=1 Tax=unclassified Streptomyces TaxID=2593676 RepID=UPI00190E3C26|nr:MULTISPECIES: hypothetical protein [unclassified Streptomyces]MBK3626080.1 hypothetical protein [Streptomyces sp. MBT49]MBK3633749.1 hypothetical protein [Streptomyces sp. MBT97]
MSAPTTAPPVDAERTGRRIEEVLDRLATNGDPAVAAAAEELVRSLMDLYGAGLARALHLLSAAKGDPVAGLLGDELVASLLVLHDLHPEDRDTRVARAVDRVREPALDIVDFDEESGTLTLRARESAGCGCGSADSAKEAARAALACFAPEVRNVEVETAPAGPTLLQIGTAPTGPR